MYGDRAAEQHEKDQPSWPYEVILDLDEMLDFGVDDD